MRWFVQKMKNYLLRSYAFICENPLLIAFIILAVMVRVCFWAYTDRVWEDALITLAPSKNIWLGYGLTHHLSEPRVHSFTSPLSVLTPIIGQAFDINGLIFLKLTAILGAIAAIYFAYRIGFLLKFHWSAQVLLLSYLATDQLQIFFGMTGMETQLATAIFLGNVYYFLREEWTLLGVFSGLGMLARPEFIIWVGIIGLFMLIWHPRKIINVLIPFLIVSMPWYLFAHFYYGSIIPNTIVAKNIGYNASPFKHSIAEMWQYFRGSWGSIAPFKEWSLAISIPIPKFYIAVVVGIVLMLSLIGLIRAYRHRD